MKSKTPMEVLACDDYDNEDVSGDSESDYSEEEEENCEEEDEETGPPPAKQARLNKGELYKPPTNEELHQLKETENLYQSSLFRLQITELLNEVLMNEKQKKTVDKFLHYLKDFLTSLPETKEHEISKQKWLLKKDVKVPLVQKPFNVKGKFKFVAPSSVRVVGSYLLGTSIYPDHHVDVALLMPKECFQAKDHLNHRLFRKQALYLACLAWKMKGQEKIDDMKFTYHNGDHMKPILIVRGKSCKKTAIRIHVTSEDDQFKFNRFHITKNNVRPNWFNESPADESEQAEDSLPATPVYNTAILSSLTLDTNLQLMHSVVSDHSGIREGIALLKVWLHQRELDVGYGCFSGFIMTMYVSYLLRKRKLNSVMSSYQVMRNTLMNLRNTDWCTEGATLCSDSDDPHRPSLVEFHKAFDVVFVDSTGYTNLCSGMTIATYNRVVEEAKLSFGFMEDSLSGGFDALFMKPVPFLKAFDQMFHLSSIESFTSCIVKWDLQSQALDEAGNTLRVCLPRVLSLLKQALGRRIKMLAVKPIATKQWAVNEEPPDFSLSGQPITFGVLLDPEMANSILDKGPSADSEEANDFRQFWGDKSQLRRFQDGSICEAVVWPSKTLSDRRRVCGKIVKHILERHADVRRDKITCISSQLDDLVKVKQNSKKNTLPYGTGEEQQVAVIRVYDQLAKILRSLKELPLLIHAVQGTAPVFRCAQVFPAIPATYTDMYVCDTQRNRLTPLDDEACPAWTPSMKVICTLESSGKWPDDKEAIRRVKAAFLITLSKLLNKTHSLLNQVYTDHLDVLKDGYVFRLELAYMREIAVLKTVQTPEGMVKTVETEEALDLEKNIVMLPKLTSTLHGLQQQHSCYSVCVRLAARWVAAHMLSDFVPQEAVELVVAHLFTSPEPFRAPNSPITGFVRFLSLLTSHDWKTSPLIVNLNNELKKEDIAEIQTNFNKMRSSLPLMCIATPDDKLTSVWTKSQPSSQILQRLVLLAHESLGVLDGQLMDTSLSVDFKQIFRPPLDVYDVIIKIKPEALCRHHLAVDVQKGTYTPCHREYQTSTEGEYMPVIDFDPVRIYLKELRESFSEVALFFHDPHGGAVIAVLWKPTAFEPKPFKILHAECHMLNTEASKSAPMLVPNVEAIIQDFRILGDGLVKDIHSKTEKWTI